ncbi:MAG: hypothetical protein J5793_02510 [Clostridia bacterium]|nr:hypothetical protein [Clostridia bacterium]
MLKYVFFGVAIALFAVSLFLNKKVKDSMKATASLPDEEKEEAAKKQNKLRIAIYSLDAVAAACAIAVFFVKQ